MVSYVAKLGEFISGSLRGVGEIFRLFLRCLWLLSRGLPYGREVRWQLYFVGVQSLPVVLTTGAFAGGVLAYSFYSQLLSLGVGSWTGALVAKALVWQLGPVLACIMLAGRVGCAMTAEIGTMNVTEQVDALRTIGTDPVGYLVVPRLLAFLVMAPILTAFAMLTGILAGLALVIYGLGAEAHYQWVSIQDWMVPYDYVQGLSKSVVFGVVTALICCRNGLRTAGGAEGVGKSTTSANVSSCIAILVLNLFLTMILLALQPAWDVFASYLGRLLAPALQPAWDLFADFQSGFLEPLFGG